MSGRCAGSMDKICESSSSRENGDYQRTSFLPRVQCDSTSDAQAVKHSKSARFTSSKLGFNRWLSPVLNVSTTRKDQVRLSTAMGRPLLACLLSVL